MKSLSFTLILSVTGREKHKLITRQQEIKEESKDLENQDTQLIMNEVIINLKDTMHLL